MAKQWGKILAAVAVAGVVTAGCGTENAAEPAPVTTGSTSGQAVLGGGADPVVTTYPAQGGPETITRPRVFIPVSPDGQGPADVRVDVTNWDSWDTERAVAHGSLRYGGRDYADAELVLSDPLTDEGSADKTVFFNTYQVSAPGFEGVDGEIAPVG